MRRSLLLVLLGAVCVGCSQSGPSAPTDAATALSAPAPSADDAASESTEAAANVPSEPSSDQEADPLATVETKPAPVPSKSQPESRTAAKVVIAEYSADVPAVEMSAAECAECNVGVGDRLPEITLPKLAGGEASLSSLAGKQATIVLFWGADRWMSHSALADLQKDAAKASDGVAVVGVAVGLKPDAAAEAVEQTAARFPQLVDVDGEALAKLGAPALPRVYVLDAAGKIAWFDIEYSEATRRDLHATISALTADKP